MRSDTKSPELDKHLEHCEQRRQWLASLSPEERAAEEEKQRKQQTESERRRHIAYAKNFLSGRKEEFEQLHKNVSGKLLETAKENEAKIIYWLLYGNDKWPEEITSRHKNLFQHWFNIKGLRDAYPHVYKGEEPGPLSRYQCSWEFAQAWAYGRYLAWLQSDTTSTERQPGGRASLIEGENMFCPGMLLEVAYDHFHKLATANSNKRQPYLSERQFENFFLRAFKGEDIKMEALTMGREAGTVRHLFYQFYDQSRIQYEAKTKEQYVRLLSDNLEGFPYDTTFSNFAKEPGRKIR